MLFPSDLMTQAWIELCIPHQLVTFLGPVLVVIIWAISAVNSLPPVCWDSANNAVLTNYSGSNSLPNCYLVCMWVSEEQHTFHITHHLSRISSVSIPLGQTPGSLAHSHVHTHTLGMPINHSCPWAFYQKLQKIKIPVPSLNNKE